VFLTGLPDGAARLGKCMISNERPAPFGSRSHGDRPHGNPKPPVNEDTLKTAKIQIERKTFVLALKENLRGRFLRITEDVGGRRDTIIIPAPGLEEFQKVLDEMVKASAETPPKAE
jgi:PurA ssDNA and RNA-binding protein